MNNTKWNELFLAFYNTEHVIMWRTRDIENGYLSNWDASWSHFGCEPKEYDKIDYLQIKLSPENKTYVIDTLKRIHVPGEIAEDIIVVYGYRTDVDYL